MTYETYPHGFETQRLNGAFSTGGIFNGIQLAYDNLAGGNFVIGQPILDTTTGATGTVRDVIVDTATTGRLAIENPLGTFANNDGLQQGAVTALQDGGVFRWDDLYALGGETRGDTVYTRPGVVHSIIVERPFIVAAGGTANVLVLDRNDQRLAEIPPVSGDTSMAFVITGTATQGSYPIPIHFQARKGIIVRFENLAPSTGLIAVVYRSFGRHEFIASR